MTRHLNHSSVVLVVSPNGLICSVSRGKNLDDWNLPGGKGEVGETPKETAVREMREETGLKIHNLEWVMTQYNEEWPTYYYLADYNGEIRDSDEGRTRWISKDELLQPHHTFFETNSNLFRKLEEISASE